jgi:hypothetical protein
MGGLLSWRRALIQGGGPLKRSTADTNEVFRTVHGATDSDRFPQNPPEDHFSKVKKSDSSTFFA